MLKLGFRSLCCAISLACASAALLTGCSSADQGEAVEDGGSVNLALTTTGADGAVYGFPEGSYLQVSTSSFSDWIPLWGPDAQLTRTMPAGAYSASLYFENNDVKLTRSDGSSTSVVSAEWTNPQPVTFMVVKGQTTPLALHFSVDSLVDLVFDTGTLHVIADVVEEEVEQPATATLSGTSNFWNEGYGDPTAAYATALDVEQGVEVPLSMGFSATAPWQQLGSTSVCQIGSLAEASSSESAGLNARLRELVGGIGYLCVTENGASDQVSFFPSNYGAPPAGQEVFLPGTTYGFYGGFSALTGDVYDGTTLKQTELEEATLENGYFYHQVYDELGNQVSTVQGTLNATLRLLP